MLIFVDWHILNDLHGMLSEDFPLFYEKFKLFFFCFFDAAILLIDSTVGLINGVFDEFKIKQFLFLAFIEFTFIRFVICIIFVVFFSTNR